MTIGNIGANGSNGASGSGSESGSNGQAGGNGFSDGTYDIVHGGNGGNGGSGGYGTYDPDNFDFSPGGSGGNAGAAGTAILTASGTLAHNSYTVTGGNGANGGDGGDSMMMMGGGAGGGSDGGAATINLSSLTSDGDLDLSLAATGGMGGASGYDDMMMERYANTGGASNVSLTNSTVGVKNLSIVATPGSVGYGSYASGASSHVAVTGYTFSAADGMALSLTASGGMGAEDWMGMGMFGSMGDASIALASNSFQGNGAFTLAIDRSVYVDDSYGPAVFTPQVSVALDLNAGTLSYGV